MNSKDIIKLWLNGLNKYQVAKEYQRRYNQRIKIIRLNPRHRYERFMTNREALECVEKVILEYVRRDTKNE